MYRIIAFALTTQRFETLSITFDSEAEAYAASDLLNDTHHNTAFAVICIRPAGPKLARMTREEMAFVKRMVA